MNTPDYREIESKFAAKAETFTEGIIAMREILEFYHYTIPGSVGSVQDAKRQSKEFAIGQSHDYYYSVPELNGSTSDFVRLRRNIKPGTINHVITSKKTDKGDSVDREEVNVEVSREQFRATRKILRATLGREVIKFVQDYALFRPDPSVHSLVVSVKTISISDIVFIAVEGPDLAIVEHWCSVIKPITQRQYKKSLWDLFNLGGL